jgi:ABC-type sugar transport system permease subunit
MSNLKNKITVFSLIYLLFVAALFLLLIFTCFPVLNSSLYSGSAKEIFFETPFEAEISDYILLTIKAKNSKTIAQPKSSLTANIETRSPGTGNISMIQFRQEFYIDGLPHNYYLPVGEYKKYNFDTGNQESESLKNRIRSIKIEIPEIKGVKVDLLEVRFCRRTFFALDSHLNYFFKKYAGNFYTGNFITIFKSTNNFFRYSTCSYLFIISGIICTGVYRLGARILRNKKPAGPPDIRTLTPRTGFSVFALPVLVCMLVFSFLFAAHNFFTIKSYWDSYKNRIPANRLEGTWQGFYNFRQFTGFVAENVPEDENIIILIKGQPVYIMAELAYNLYPRDLEFISISGLNMEEITGKIRDFSDAPANEEKSYRYLLILDSSYVTEYEIIQNTFFELIGKYRQDAGFLYRIATEN